MDNTADINYFKDPLTNKTGEEAFKNKLPSILESHETEINNLDTNKLEKGGYTGTAEDLKNDIILLSEEVGSKQENLVSGENIKTINGESLLGTGNIIIEGNSFDNSKDKFGYFDRIKNPNRGTYNPNPMQRLVLFLGDSHTWGQGAMNENISVGGGYLSRHQPPVNFRGYAHLLKEYIESEVWNRKPFMYLPSKLNPNPTNENFVELIIESNMITNRTFYGNDNKTFEIKDNVFYKKNIITNSKNLEETTLDSGVFSLFNSNDFTLYNAEFRGETVEAQAYGLNAELGLFGKEVMNVFPSIKENEYHQAMNNTGFTGNNGFTYVNANKNLGIMVAGFDGGTYNFMTISEDTTVMKDFLKIRGMGNNFTATEKDKRNCYIEYLGWVVIEAVSGFGTSQPTNILFRKPNGTTFTSGELANAPKNFRIYNSDYPFLLMPLNQSERILTFHLLKSAYQNCRVRVSLMPYSIATNFENIKNWNYTSWGSEEYYGAIPNTSVQNLKRTGAKTYTIDNTMISYPVDTSKKYIEIETSNGANLNEYIYNLFFDRNVEGILKIEMVDSNLGRAYKTNTLPYCISTRGYIGGSSDIVKNISMGCHSVGGWLGYDNDNCGNSGEPIDSITGVNHVEDLLTYCTVLPRLVVIQAPIVNEFLKQTPIATYKTNLTALKTLLGTDNIIIFAGVGQYAKDEDFGGVNDQPISYKMYRQATKEWAESQNDLCTYVDMIEPINKYLSMTGTNIQDLVVDSNHPSNLQNRIWFEELKKIIDKKI